MIRSLFLKLHGYQAFQESCICHHDLSCTARYYMFLKLEQLNIFREYMSGFIIYIKTIIYLFQVLLH